VIIEPGPGAQPFSQELSAQLSGARREGPPRTSHLRDDGSAKFTNRLALETSPYLLQHAHNPVDWHPWAADTFAKARALDRPIFLSVGYATCHWCHVMEEESFESVEIAQLLNERFVAVKVDREERPDVDAIYMQAVQMMTQHGGWPMSVFLTHDLKPFFGGTYFPPRDGDRGSRFGFRTVLLELDRVWREERPRISSGAEQLAGAVRQQLLADAPALSGPGIQVLHDAREYYGQIFDSDEGGARRAPKFPSSFNVRFLLRDPESRPMAIFTLEKMALGGIYDHVGGGFHRYSTDGQWLVPHFEKMLYDNALLTLAYVEGWQATGAGFFERIACETLDYVAREMTLPDGAFLSAQDADSLDSSGRREEGAFFAWSVEELRATLGPEDGERAARLFRATGRGNFEGKNVLSLASVPSAEDLAFVERVRPLLYAARSHRTPPLTDTKVLTSWNGLMISAFARAGFAFGRADYVQRASRAAENFLAAPLMRTGKHAALLEDHSFLAQGLLDLYEVSGEARWLAKCIELHETLQLRFAAPGGGFYRTAEGGEELLAREKPAYDGAEPTGNSIAALTLLKLSAITGEDRFRQRAEELLRSFGALLSGAPAALGEMLLAVDLLLADPREVVLVRPRGGSDEALLDVLRPRFAPSQVLVRHEEGDEAATPLARDRPAMSGLPTAYVCHRGACQLPVTDGASLEGQL
jgi:uncharacterized protein